MAPIRAVELAILPRWSPLSRRSVFVGKEVDYLGAKQGRIGRPMGM
jgi:hypothetical protein